MNTPTTAQGLALLAINRTAQLHPLLPKNQQLLMTIGLLSQVIVDTARIDDYTLQELLKHLSEY
jgi:hypothetical protein